MDSKPKSIKKCDPNQIPASKAEEDQAIARAVLRPTVQAAFTLRECGRIYGRAELSGLVIALTEQIRASGDGNLERAGAMLTAQAHTMDGIFNLLARLALNSENLDTLDRYLKLGLRAQSQCRMTWEALATIRNPRMMGYVRQANFAHGPQQINNASAEPERASREREKANLKIKLLDENDVERLDFGAACTPGQADPAMATMGEVDRPKVG